MTDVDYPSLTDEQRKIMAERQPVYGEPRENHMGIAQMWASVLQPWHKTIEAGDPLPPHVVALLMSLLKVNRMRRQFHKDNYDDVRVYLAFAEKWQEEYARGQEVMCEVRVTKEVRDDG